jgi:hypothetical protein
MNLFEHDYEPIPGLPAKLPAGETILWQGSPDWRVMARRGMRVRVVSVYFIALMAWGISGGMSAGAPVAQIAVSALRLGGLGGVAVALLATFAWLVARTTIYTITTRRVVMRFGVAMPMTIQMAFSKIDSVGLHVWLDGSGDIALTLQPGQRIAYLVLWPHARPWKMSKAEPTLRCVREAAVVAQILGRALAASALQPATPMAIKVGAGADSSVQVPAAA